MFTGHAWYVGMYVGYKCANKGWSRKYNFLLAIPHSWILYGWSLVWHVAESCRPDGSSGGGAEEVAISTVNSVSVGDVEWVWIMTCYMLHWLNTSLHTFILSFLRRLIFVSNFFPRTST